MMSRALFCILFFVPLVFAVVAWIVPPGVFSDSGFGFLVWQSMDSGAPFNHLRSPDPSNIAQDADAFLSWWSPGQYLLPGMFLTLGLNYGQAIVLTVLLSMWLGLWGWLLVARRAGATLWVQTVFIIALATFRYSTLPFRMYNGGEILIFAAAPWALLAIWSALGRGFWWSFAAAFGSALLLVVAKLSGLIVFAVMVSGLVVVEWWQRRRITAAQLGLAAGSMVAAILFWWGWISRGENPAGEAVPGAIWAAWLFPPAAAAFGGFTLQDFLARFLLHPDLRLLPGRDLSVLAWVLGPAGLALMYWVWRRLAKDRASLPWARLSAAFVVLQMLALAVLYTKGSSISFEERHLRYAGIVVLLSALMAADLCGTRGRRIVMVLVGCFSLYGIISFAIGVRQTARSGDFDAVTGIQQSVVGPGVLRYLAAQAGGSESPAVFLPSAEAGLALPGWRIDAVQLDFTPLAVIETRKRDGRVPELYVVMQSRMETNGKAELVLRNFRDYRREEWKRTDVEDSVIYYAGGLEP